MRQFDLARAVCACIATQYHESTPSERRADSVVLKKNHGSFDSYVCAEGYRHIDQLYACQVTILFPMQCNHSASFH